MDWRDRKAPTASEFDGLVRAAYDLLPPEFRALCEGLVLHSADFAEEEILADLGIDDPFELTGLYEGVDVTRRTLADPAPTPDHVHLYRMPILAEWVDDGEITLGDLVRHVLVHEIGHHFGLSDEDIHRIENVD